MSVLHLLKAKNVITGQPCSTWAKAPRPDSDDRISSQPREGEEPGLSEDAGSSGSNGPNGGGLEEGQDTLSFARPMRKRTREECYEIIPPDHSAWWEDSQCFADCQCWFCEIVNGLVPDIPKKTSKAPKRDQECLVVVDSEPETGSGNA